MTRSREIFQMDSNQMSDSDKNDGFYLTKKQIFLYVLLLVISSVFTAWLSHYFTLKSSENENSSEGIFNNSCYSIITPDHELGYEIQANEKSASKVKFKDIRLPRSVIPDYYEVKVIPFIIENNFTFSGNVKILVNVTENTDNITLHVKQLEVDGESVKVEEKSGKVILVDRLSQDIERQFFITHTREQLLSGHQYVISMNFTGSLNDELQGFYRSSYSVGNTKKWVATTQFQATDARRAFPCFDEPALKARFKLFIGRHVNFSSISNMPQLITGKPISDLPDYVWDEYEESVPMSTYLVAFIVSDFSHISNGNRFSVWAREAAVEQAKYSLNIGPKILNYFEKYFDIDFPLPKVDLVALPDFAAGAMENWGLITFRETAMLYKEGVSSSSNKQRVATVVSHELAHQWFGNLVTPSWWSDLWLNEGFASYVEYLGVESVEPTWKIMEQFIHHEIQHVFALDALRSSHQISVEVRDPDEISEIFDGISYRKGSSVIRMMDHFLTTNVFKRGLTKYLKRHKYGSTEQDDLWRALTEQAQEDQVLAKNMSVKAIMDTWTLQTGYPVVTVKRNYETNTAEIRQERFTLYKATGQTEKVLWWVPITYTTKQLLNFNSTYPSYWLQREEKISIENMPGPNDWVIFNIQQTGFYRVNYDEKNWELLTSQLKNSNQFGHIIPINRAQLIDDAFNLARGKLLSYNIAMNVTRYLENEVEYLPWMSAFSGFHYMNTMLVKTAGYDKFKNYLLKIIDKVYSKVGFETSSSDPLLTIYTRISVLAWACKLEHQQCVKNSMAQFENWKKMSDPDTNNPISPDLKKVVYCTAIAAGGEEEWNFAWERFKNANIASERDVLLESLGCSRNVWILSRALEWSLTKNSGIRKQDIARLFNAIASNPVGQVLAFNLLTEQWNRLKNYLGSSLYSLSSIVRSATKAINSKSQFKQFSDFANKYNNEFGSGKRSVQQGLEQAEANIRWMEQNYDSLIEWLSDAIR